MDEFFRDVARELAAPASRATVGPEVLPVDPSALPPGELHAEILRLRARVSELEAQRVHTLTPLFSGLLDAAPDGMLVVDGNGAIRVANAVAETLFGYPPSGLVGLPVETLLPASLRDGHAAHRHEFRANPHTRRMGVGMELAAVRRDGSELPVEVSLRPLDTADGWFVAVAVRDVTERRQAEEASRHQREALARSNDALQQFAYVASHDLQEPLRMVSSYLQLLERRYGPALDADAREFIGFAVDGAKRMKALIDDLLAYARAGRSEAEWVTVDLGDLVRGVVDDLALAVREADATVVVGALPTVQGEPRLLGQLFHNLLSNALKFRRPGVAPRIEVSARHGAEGWVVAVADDGIGIEPRYFERIFQIFQRLHTRTEYPGTGIGLAICKRVAEHHGGTLSVTSNPGQGTTFSVCFPDRRRAWPS